MPLTARPVPYNNLITVEPRTVVKIFAHFLNQAYFTKILKAGDTNVNLIFRKQNGGIVLVRLSLYGIHLSQSLGRDRCLY